MKKVILTLKTMLPAKQFIVTGSWVLAEYGLVPYNKVRDLDIILIAPEPAAIEIINRFMKDSPAPTTKNFQELTVENPNAGVKKAVQSNLQAIFMFDITKVDIYIEPTFSEPTLLVNGLEYTTVPHILQAKKRYGRMKDWLQCRDIARLFFKTEDFTERINRDWQDMLRGGTS